jgi:8-oxo-dGTP pyrophosphatase MutT (NUDIX family)
VSIYAIRRRVACYVTRTSAAGLELLVFDHAEDDPSEPSGVQVPAGGMLPFESIEAAALREVEEESGLVGLRFESQLGAAETAPHEPGGASVTTYVHLSAPDTGPRSWQHVVSGGGDDRGMTFICRWEPLPLGIELAPGHADYLGQLSQ